MEKKGLGNHGSEPKTRTTARRNNGLELRVYAARTIFNRVRFAVAAEQRLNDSVSDWRNLRAERLLPLLWFPSWEGSGVASLLTE